MVKSKCAAQPRVVRAAMGTERTAIKGMFWGMRKDHADWSADQINTVYRLQRSNRKSARAWRLKEGLRSTYTEGVTSNCPEKAEAALMSWISWARRSRLEPFKELATTLKERLAGVVRGMLDGRSNAFVEAMNGMLQQVKRQCHYNSVTIRAIPNSWASTARISARKRVGSQCILVEPKVRRCHS